MEFKYDPKHVLAFAFLIVALYFMVSVAVLKFYDDYRKR